MGILTEGEALTPEEMRDASAYIREHGVTQFLHTWERDRDLHDDELKFGDEIECGLYVVDSVNKTVKISLRSAELRAQLDEKEGLYRHETESCTWHPEFGAWMIESTPSRPYSHYTTDLIRVERNMVLRRRRLLSLLKDNEIAPTVVNFPLLGAGDFVVDGGPFSAPHSQSAFIPDDIINPHPRFAALTRNIRARRGQKVDIQVPLYRDTHTPEFSPSFNPADPAAAAAAAELPPGYRVEPDGFIHMDAMGFGMGMNCLQVTFQARDVDESRYMYDQLAVLAPIMLAMTAATPIFKGRLAATDARWSTIAQSVDDRTPAERGELSEEQVAAAADPRLSGDGIQRIPKSRYDSISTYIYHCRGDTACHRTFAVYNDVECPVDEKVKTRLRAAGIDENLAHHIAHLFCRDPISAFHGLIELDDEKSTDHFESIQSTNWQTCRWKPPPPRLTEDDPHIGWRTEFRSMEVQLTDFENAAFTVFVVLVTRVLLAFDLSFYIPLSKVDENMRRAHVADAVNTQKFFFRRHIAPPEDHSTVIRERSTADLASLAKQLGAGGGLPTPPLPHSPLGVEGVEVEVGMGVEVEAEEGNGNSGNGNSGNGSSGNGRDGGGETGTGGCGPCKKGGPSLHSDDAYEEMSMAQIFNGRGDYFPGLLPLIDAYLDFTNCDLLTRKRVDKYISMIEKRSTGELLTPATWMRKYIKAHPAYKGDSVISPEIAHDLLVQCKGIGEGTIHCPELTGDTVIDKVRKEDAFGTILAGRLIPSEKHALLKSLALRGRNKRPAHVPRGKTRSLSVDETLAALDEVLKGMEMGGEKEAEAVMGK